MSWSHYVVIDVEHVVNEIETEIENLIDHRVIHAKQPAATETQVNAASTAAQMLASAVSIPVGHDLAISVGGHSQANAPGTMPDSIGVSVSVIPHVVKAQ